MYAAIRIPQFALQAALRTEAFGPEACVAVLRETAQRSIIFQANSFASRYGVREGQTVSQAIAKCRDLLVRPRKPLAEKAARLTLFSCIYAYTPFIESTSEESYTLQLQGIPAPSLHARIRDLLTQLKQLGFSPQIGVAETADWANYAAICAQPLLWIEDAKVMFKEISIHAAVDDPQLRSILSQWGIKTLADFAALSQQAIGERLGRPGLLIWQSLHRKNQRLLKIESPPVECKSCMELEFEIESLEPLLFVINRLIEQLCLQLKANFLKAQVLILQLDLDDKRRYRKLFKLPEPTLNRQKMQQVLHTHLENLQTTAAIQAVSLEIIPTDAADHQPQLFQQQVKDPWQLASTLHQLIGLVGSENVGTPVLRNSHEPDAFTMKPLSHTLDPLPGAVERSFFEVHQLKLQRFRPPQPVTVKLQDTQLLSIVSNLPNPAYSGCVLSQRGPWRLSGNWWDPTRWSRMEWDVQLESGSLLRLLYTQKKWYLEGAYG